MNDKVRDIRTAPTKQEETFEDLMKLSEDLTKEQEGGELTPGQKKCQDEMLEFIKDL